jgi:hypothetical protein
MLHAVSGMSETPAEPDNQFVQCAKCGTRNPAEVTQCLGCGEPLAPPAAAALTRMPRRWRLLVSGLIGVLVFGIGCEVGYRQYCSSAVRYDQSLTLRDIDRGVKAIEAYREEHHALPKALSEVEWTGGQVDRDGTPLDWWRRPLHYSTDGTRFQIVSYGQDGKPGGTGLDYDLSTADLPKAREQWSEGAYASNSDLPRQTVPTFHQFVTYDSHSNSGSGRMMFLMSILAGVVASVLSLREIGKPVSGEEASMPRWLRLFIIIGGTLLIAIMYLIPLHVPSGH